MFMKFRRHSSAGFTILELMIASTVFSVILLIIAIGVISFTNDYYKGVTSSKTQAVARSIINTVTQSIQFGKDINTNVPGGASGTQGICIDNTLYSYVIGQEVVDAAPDGSKHQAWHGLVADSGGCGVPTVPNSNNPLGPTARELLGPRMRLGIFDVTATGSLYTVHVRVIDGDDDVLNSTNWPAALCVGNVIGGQFCAVSDLTTTVQQRLL